MFCSWGKKMTLVPKHVLLRRILKATVPPVCFLFLFFVKALFKLTFSSPILKEFLTHQIPQTPCRSASRRLWCAAGCFPEWPGQSEDSYTVGSPRCSHTSSHCSCKQTGPQICSQRSWELPEWSGSANSLEGWPAALRSTTDETHEGKKLINY